MSKPKRRRSPLTGMNLSEVGRALGVSRQVVWNWSRRGIPPEWVIPLETATRGAVSRHVARPDIYPREGR